MAKSPEQLAVDQAKRNVKYMERTVARVVKEQPDNATLLMQMRRARSEAKAALDLAEKALARAKAK